MFDALAQPQSIEPSPPDVGKEFCTFGYRAIVLLFKVVGIPFCAVAAIPTIIIQLVAFAG